jgi:hypothetical protein
MRVCCDCFCFYFPIIPWHWILACTLVSSWFIVDSSKDYYSHLY